MADALQGPDPAGSDVSDDASWLDAESEDEVSLTFISLLDDLVFPDAISMLNHCKEKHNFDFLAIRQRLGLDFHGTVKLINFIRHHVHEGIALPDPISADHLQEDGFLKPVVEDDALIMSIDDLIEEPESTLASRPADQLPSLESLLARNSQLEEEIARTNDQFANYRLAVQKTLDERWGDDTTPLQATRAKIESPRFKDESQYYWESYAGNDIHETMLKDTVRTDAYRDFVYNNKQLFNGKVVLDIGCGTGILSMFCARAGASKVYAVDKSDIIDKAHENVFHNGLSEVVSCIRGRIEEITLPVGEVDIIISEWMGYCLLYEAMLPSIIWARDRYLKPDGLLVPSVSTLWIAPTSDSEYVAEHVLFWADVYGFDMKAMQEGLYDDARIHTWPEKAICGTPSQFMQLDLHTVRTQDLDFKTNWQSVISRDVDSLDGFLVWFDIFFTTSRDKVVPAKAKAEDPENSQNGQVAFTTGPFGTETHWKQGLLLIKQEDQSIGLKSGSEVSGEISFIAPENNPRALNIQTSWTVPNQQSRSQSWKLR